MPDHLLRRDAIDLLRVHAHKILAAARDDVGPLPIGAQVLQNFKHRLVSEIGIEPLPARMFGGLNPLLCLASNTSTDMPVSVAKRISSSSRNDSLAISSRLPERRRLAGLSFPHGPPGVLNGPVLACFDHAHR